MDETKAGTPLRPGSTPHTSFPHHKVITFVAEYPGSVSDEDAVWEVTDPVPSPAVRRRGPGRPPAGVSADERELFEEFRVLRHEMEAGRTFEGKSVAEVARAIRQLDVITAVLPTGESQVVVPKSWRPSWAVLPESRVRGIVQRHADKGGRIDAVPLLYELLAAPRRKTSDAIRNLVARVPARDTRLETFDLHEGRMIGVRLRPDLRPPEHPLHTLLVQDPTGRIQGATTGRSWQLWQLDPQRRALGELKLGR